MYPGVHLDVSRENLSFELFDFKYTYMVSLLLPLAAEPGGIEALATTKL